MSKHVQIICNDIVEKYAEQFPILAKEVKEADTVSHSSWYDLSDDAYHEFLVWDKMTDDIGKRNKLLHNQKIMLNRLRDMLYNDACYTSSTKDKVLEMIDDSIEEINNPR